MKINFLLLLHIMRQSYIKMLFYMYILFFSVCIFANSLTQFKQFIVSTKSARGDFIQNLVKIDADNIQILNTSSGNFIFMRPNKFIWTYKKSYERILQADGEKLFIYDKDLNQVITRKLVDILDILPTVIIFGNNEIEKKFILQDNGIKGNLAWLKIKPKNKYDTFFEQIDIGFKNNFPQKVQLRDTFGKISLFSFKNFEKNSILKSYNFCFIIPQGTEVFNN